MTLQLLEKHAFITGSIYMHCKKYASHIPICMGHVWERPFDAVECAVSLRPENVQFFKPCVNREMYKKAHINGTICNIFFADNVTEARECLEMGIHTVLTNNCNIISQIKTELV